MTLFLEKGTFLSNIITGRVRLPNASFFWIIPWSQQQQDGLMIETAWTYNYKISYYHIIGTPLPLLYPHNQCITNFHQRYFEKQPTRGVLKKRCSENMQQICRRTPMPKCDFNKVAKQIY